MMCGHYTLSIKDLSKHYGTVQGAFKFSSYNIAPTQAVPIVMMHEGQRTVSPARWGLIPSWTKALSHMKVNLFNARTETAHEKPSFRTPLRYRRSLIPADGFYEWKREGDAKTPYYIRVGEGKPFAFAGLFDLYKDELPSCTILTTASNETMAKIHDRMPVILAPENYARWLKPSVTKPEELEELLQPFAGAMHAQVVSNAVNSPKNNSPDLIAAA